MLQEFITLNDLDILNQRVFPPTLQNSRGQSYIDLTLTTQATTTYISNWEVLESLAMSDHKAIVFTFRTNPCDDDTPPPVHTEHVAETLHNWNEVSETRFPALSSPEQIDAAMELLCYINATRRRRLARRPDWWTDEVERYKKIYMGKKTLFYRNRHPENAAYLH
ncbi:hypothetical protein MTP99_003799 [Tenebrio molitor]|jgi:hypothetical protein|nr:hypothetical protein MTP99_003799 [Tenebrio molitor]